MSKLKEGMSKLKNFTNPKLELLSVYDEIETYTDCTVQVLTNSVTGNQSVGWWRNDKPPMEIKWGESK